MKLVHITTVAASLEFVRGQIAFMRRNGFEACVISSPGPDLDDFADAESVTAYAVDMPRRISPCRDLLSLWRLWQVLRRIRPDVVHSHTPKGGMLGTLAAWLTRVPVRVYHMHGLPFVTATGIRRLLLKLSELIACWCATSVLCVSHSIRGVAVAERLCPPNKIKVLLSGTVMGVDASVCYNPEKHAAGTRARIRSEYGIPLDAPVVGFVGRIVRDKGIVELAEAWNRLRQDFPTLHLVVAGPPEPQDPVPQEIVQQLHNDDRVHLPGLVPAATLYTAIDILVLPTYREGFPTVVLEASAMELPVVATSVPGCVDAVEDGITGTLVPVRDAASMRVAIAAYLNDGELCRRHGRAGRERVLQDYKPEDVWQAMLSEYHRLLHSAGLPVPKSSCPTPKETWESVA